MTDWQARYVLPAVLVGGLVFLGAWGYAVAAYGWFLGVGLGWLPALVIGAVAGLLWPFLVLAAVALGVLLYVAA